MTIWTPELTGRDGPKYRAISEAIRDAIAEGSLAAGAKLPPQRELAYALGLSLGTVSRAYKDAERQEMVSGEVGRGTYVRPDGSGPIAETLWSPARDSHGPISLVMNLPPAGIAAPALAETFRDLGRMGDLGSLLDHQTGGRIEVHQRSAASWLGRLGLEARGEEIVLTNGAQHGVLMALMAATRPGDTLLAEKLSYPPLKQMAHHLDLRLEGLEMDADGILPAALEAACRKKTAKVLYCMPTLQSPTGATMPVQRRRDIADIARNHGLTIIEDDVFGFLPEDRPAPLAAYFPEGTLFVTSVSKSLAPGLRIGIVRAPEAHRETLRNVVQMSCWMPSPITAEIAHRWIEDGTADRLNEWLRREMRARCLLAQGILGSAADDRKGLRFHLWIELTDMWMEEAFRAAAEERDVKVAPGEIFMLKPGPAPQSLRLALGYETSRERLGKGLAVVADLLANAGARQAVIV
ncbi:MAG: PLP-dependent aminotransferase family protein [Alphaproteobacteria bacterium]|jgi:DNA-binding transcriptional MocR family regulator|nr:PLP-dependent aminotransferase family protein [Alphaproteobacteria bacterium]|tara:strand:+ start:1511 stop:2905 length:1395 start_codon:yes stop_codon:yes gene_type:complete